MDRWNMSHKLNCGHVLVHGIHTLFGINDGLTLWTDSHRSACWQSFPPVVFYADASLTIGY